MVILGDLEGKDFLLEIMDRLIKSEGLNGLGSLEKFVTAFKEIKVTEKEGKVEEVEVKDVAVTQED